MQLAEKGETPEMSTQSYTTNPETINQQVTGPSRNRRWVLAVGAVVAAVFVALALMLWHAQSSAAPAGNGTSHTQTVSPAVPAKPTANPAIPVRPTFNPADPATPAS
jgi:hypothetical protein